MHDFITANLLEDHETYRSSPSIKSLQACKSCSCRFHDSKIICLQKLRSLYLQTSKIPPSIISKQDHANVGHADQGIFDSKEILADVHTAGRYYPQCDQRDQRVYYR